VYTLQQSINWSQAFIEYSPLTAGTGSEPAVSIASIIRSTVLNAPLIWPWNRVEYIGTSTIVGTQDYILPITDFGFIEKVSLVDGIDGKIYEMKDVYNTAALSISSTQQRPNAACVISNIPGTSIKLRFMGVPDKVYSITISYQKAAILFNQFSIISAANALGGNTVYTGIFTPASFPVGSLASVSGFVTLTNNGTFLVVSATPSVLTLANAAGVAETRAAMTINQSWYPIPDYFSDVFNSLFLAEAFQSVDDARATQYRQRGIAALLSKAEGLTLMQVNAFLAQWGIRNSQTASEQLKVQQSTQARGV
jgi:hypothetical protein